MASGDSPHNSNRVTVAIFLLALSACYAVIVEAWSAPILFMDSRGATFVAGLIAGILIFYAVYGWLIYQVWKRAAWAKWALLVLIALGIFIHVRLAFGGMGELFGPVWVTAFLDGLRVVAAILLLIAPTGYWQRGSDHSEDIAT